MAYCHLVAKTPARGWWCTSGESAGASTYKFFINDLDDGTENIHKKFADDTNIGRVTDKPDGCASIQRDLSRLENEQTGTS